MLNKRKKNILDPMRINNYNKFLSSLDNTNSPKKLIYLLYLNFDALDKKKYFIERAGEGT